MYSLLITVDFSPTDYKGKTVQNLHQIAYVGIHNIDI